MINGHTAEAQKGFATLDDVDTGTFVRFIEWAHRGYYATTEFPTVEVPTAVEEPSATWDPTAVEEPSIPWDPTIEVPQEIGGRSAKKSKFRKGTFSLESSNIPNAREDLKQAFKSRRPVERKSAIEVPPPRRNQTSSENYSDVFLSHARLYVFTEKYDIQPLKALALDELHAILAVFHLYPDRTGDIVDLLRYVYAYTGEPREGIEDMRTLMTQYISYEMDTLMGDQDFRDLMIEDGGPLLGDFMAMVGRRIS